MALDMSAFKRHSILNKHLRAAAANPALRKTKYQLQEIICNDLDKEVSISTIEHDLTALKKDYHLEIKRKKNHEGKITYAFTNPYVSIYDNSFDEEDAEKARKAIERITMYASQGQFHDIHSALPIIRKAFFMETSSIKKTYEDSIYFEDISMDVEWYNYLPELFSHIQNQCVLRVLYKPYNKPISEFDFHPHILKQYNRRWFCLGHKHVHEITNEEDPGYTGSKANIALDRIKKIEILNEKELQERSPTHREYITSTTNWDEYFDSFVGVTKPIDKEEEVVEIWVSKNRANYISTKPIHCSQKSPRHNDETITISGIEGYKFSFKLVVNREFESVILGLGSDCVVLSPEYLKQQVIDKTNELLKLYSEDSLNQSKQ